MYGMLHCKAERSVNVCKLITRSRPPVRRAAAFERMDCRIFADPRNGATYRDLLESAFLAEQLGYSGFSCPTTPRRDRLLDDRAQRGRAHRRGEAAADAAPGSAPPAEVLAGKGPP